jgi:hypothetical protein
VRIDQPMKVRGEPAQVPELPEMRDVNGLRLEGNHALYRAVQRGRIELGGAGRREGELPSVAVELAVGEAASVAREEVAGARVANHDVMPGMPGARP